VPWKLDQTVALKSLNETEHFTILPLVAPPPKIPLLPIALSLSLFLSVVLIYKGVKS
jgi:hypothetical protein